MTNVNKDSLLLLLEKRYSLQKIANELSIQKWEVRKLLKSYNLPSPLAYSRSILTKSNLENFISQNISAKEIAKSARVSHCLVSSLLKKYNIVNPNVENLKHIKQMQCSSLSIEEKGAIIGTLLGDAWLYKNNKGLITGGFQHCEKQKSYAKYKADKLKNLFRNDAHPIPYNPDIDKWFRTTGYRYLSISHPYLDYLYEVLYDSGSKEVTKELLKDLTLFGVSLWFGDDGSKNLGDKSYYFSTNSFSLESVKNLREWMYKNIGVKTSIHKSKDSPPQYKIRISTSSVGQFEKIIGPYIVELPDVSYKYGNFVIKNPQRLIR